MQTIRQIIYILILSTIFSSCIRLHNDTDEIISLKEAQFLEKEMNLARPLRFEFYDIYFLDKNGYIHKSNLDDIKQWYSLGHIENHKSLADYIYVIFNQKLGSNDSITIRSMNICCKIDSVVLDLYRREQIKGIMGKYCTYDKAHKRYKLNGISSDCELETISYLFFINRYAKHESDVVFSIGFHPFTDDFEKGNKIK